MITIIGDVFIVCINKLASIDGLLKYVGGYSFTIFQNFESFIRFDSVRNHSLAENYNELF